MWTIHVARQTAYHGEIPTQLTPVCDGARLWGHRGEAWFVTMVRRERDSELHITKVQQFLNFQHYSVIYSLHTNLYSA